jgi:hypothetical protein
MSTATTFPTELSAIAEQVELLDATTAHVANQVVTAPGTESLETALSRATYSRLYLGLEHDPGDPDDHRPATSREDDAYVRSLIAADGGRVHWTPGWRVTAVELAYTELRSEEDGMRLIAGADEIQPRHHAVGDLAHVAIPTERRFVSRGFYLTHGLVGPVPGDQPPLRWYLNAPPESAPDLFGTLIRVLDESGHPFTLKTLNDPLGPPRPDAMVLYTAREAALGVHVRTALAGVRLRSAVPAFTRRLAPGVAIADDVSPVHGRNLSFGLHRSLLVAQGVIAAGAGAPVTERHRAIAAAFRATGLDPAQPHLGPGEADLTLPGWSA